MTETNALVILNAIPGLGNRRITQLIEHFKDAQSVLKASLSELSQSVGLPGHVIDNIIHFEKDTFLEAELALVKTHHVKLVSFLDQDYPQTLRYIPDAPVILYVKGTLSKTYDRSIAIVGSRKASVYGMTMARMFSQRLSENSIHIVSGLAKGIDKAAHEGCLGVKGKTTAVIGCGLSHQYPAENRALYRDIEKHGAIISEFPMRMQPLAHNFPRRNRIISGLSKGVLVVEAAQRSGALITADFALEQGKDVYAIPGSIERASSYGVHHLIKQGAKLVTSIEDILEDFNEHLEVKKEVKLDDQEHEVFKRMKSKPVHLDEITQEVSIDAAGVSKILLHLELKQLVKQLPGQFYSKR